MLALASRSIWGEKSEDPKSPKSKVDEDEIDTLGRSDSGVGDLNNQFVVGSLVQVLMHFRNHLDRWKRWELEESGLDERWPDRGGWNPNL